MDEDLDLARRTDLKPCLYKLGNFFCLADVCLDDDGLGSTSLNLLGYLLCSLSAAV